MAIIKVEKTYVKKSYVGGEKIEMGVYVICIN